MHRKQCNFKAVMDGGGLFDPKVETLKLVGSVRRAGNVLVMLMLLMSLFTCCA